MPCQDRCSQNMQHDQIMLARLGSPETRWNLDRATPCEYVDGRREQDAGNAVGSRMTEKIPFAEALLREIGCECTVVELASDDDWIMLDGHRVAVLDADGDELGTGATRTAAIEAACLHEVRWLIKHNAKVEGQLHRLRAALRTIQNLGDE